jgi:hypothetical protein
MKRTLLFIILSAFIIFSSCRSKKIVLDNTPNDNIEIPNDFRSYLGINYKFDQDGLQDTFNFLIDQYLIDDLELETYGAEVIIEKHGDGKLIIEGKRIEVVLPLEIGLSKETFIKTVSATGILEMRFGSDIEIDKQWQLATNSQLEDYKWIEKPLLSIGGVSLPIESIANAVINQSKQVISENIDYTIKEQFVLRDKMLDIMSFIEEPFLLDTFYNAWLRLEPDTVFLSEIQKKDKWTEGVIGVRAHTIMSSEKPDKIAGLQLPDFTWTEKIEPQSVLNIQVDVDHAYVQQVINDNLVGKTFESDGKEMTIHAVKLDGYKDKVQVEAQVSGSFNGVVVLRGIPVYEKKSKLVKVDDIDIAIKTNNVLHRAGAWMFKSKIKNAIEDNLQFSISENIDLVQSKIDQFIVDNTDKDDLDLKVEILDSSLNHLYIKKERMYMGLQVQLRADLTVYDLLSLQNIEISRSLKN